MNNGMKQVNNKTRKQISLLFFALFTITLFLGAQVPQAQNQEPVQKEAVNEKQPDNLPEQATEPTKESTQEATQESTQESTQEATQEPAQEKAPLQLPEMPISDTFAFIKSMMALCFVLGLIFTAAYFFKRFSGIKTPGFSRNRVAIDLVGSMPLGEKRFLTIIQIQDKHYFLGITTNSITMLSELQLDLPEIVENDGNRGFESILMKAKDLLNRKRV